MADKEIFATKNSRFKIISYFNRVAEIVAAQRILS